MKCKSPDLSVVVPTYGRRGALDALLRNLAEQTLSAERFEVVAVDDGSPDPIVLPEEEFDFQVQLLRQDNQGPGAARNLAFEQCSGDLVLILNDDAVPAPDLLERHLAIHAERSDPVAVLGTFRFAEEVLDSPFCRILDRSNLLFDFPGLRHDELHGWTYFWTCNISLPLEAIRRVGGFDADRFREAIVEDVELGYRLEQEGYRVLHREDAVCYHAHRLTPRGYVDRMVRLGVNLIKAYRKHGDPSIVWMPESSDLEAYLQLWQLRWELYSESVPRLVERLDRLEEVYRGVEMPEETMEQVTELIRSLSTVPCGRGFAMEGAGYDPAEFKVEEAPPELRVSVVVVSYENLDRTRRCIEALRASRRIDGDFQLIVVDNGSTDGSLEYLREQPDLELIANDENLGAPRARNLAVPYATGDWVAFLDNDAMVTPGWISRLGYHARVDPRVGCLCPVSDRAAHNQQIEYLGDGSPASLCQFADQRAGRFHRRATYTRFFTSFCVVVRREVLERIGGFDERFSPWGFEDDDFALRAHLAGFRSRIALDVFVRHEDYKGAKLERHEKLLQRNWGRFVEKWAEGSPAYGDYQCIKPALARQWCDEELFVPIPGKNPSSNRGASCPA